MTNDKPRISCAPPSRDIAFEYYRTAPPQELIDELARLSDVHPSYSCIDCQKTALSIAALAIERAHGIRKNYLETVVERLAL